MARLESEDNPRIIRALLAGRLLTFSTLATATAIPTTTLDRRLKALTEAGVVSYYEPARAYGLTSWLRSANLGFKTAFEMTQSSELGSRHFRIYTVGYEGRTPESFLKVLESNGIRRLVDVREIANSRKAGFSASILSSFMGRHNIAYTHMRNLGSPRKARHKLRLDDDFGSFTKEYERLLADKKDDLNTLVGLAAEMPTAIMCFESDPSRCHRSLIASRMAQLGFEVRNL